MASVITCILGVGVRIHCKTIYVSPPFAERSSSRARASPSEGSEWLEIGSVIECMGKAGQTRFSSKHMFAVMAETLLCRSPLPGAFKRTLRPIARCLLPGAIQARDLCPISRCSLPGAIQAHDLRPISRCSLSGRGPAPSLAYPRRFFFILGSSRAVKVVQPTSMSTDRSCDRNLSSLHSVATDA